MFYSTILETGEIIINEGRHRLKKLMMIYINGSQKEKK